MKEEYKDFVTRLQGKSVRETAARLITGAWRIERESLNRYRVYEGPENHIPEPTLVIDRRSFVLLDKELYKLQARENPLDACIEIALNNNALHFCVRKASIDALNAKLIVKTFAQAKVMLDSVSTYRDNYIISFKLVQSVSERALTDKEQAIYSLFKNAQEVNLDLFEQERETALDPETLQIPAPEAEALETVETTAVEIPAE